MTKEAFQLIYNKALDLISRREHSRYELMQKLNKRYPETRPLIEEVLDKLIVNNILDDERFAEMYINSRARKGFGPKKIEMELSSKHVESFIISSSLEAYDNWIENAKKELLKKFKGIVPTDYQSKIKQKQFLFNRGFSTQIIDKVL
ncbi:MAG: regulatory protein RecX [Pseudomonadota bacterium]|nr:regulatory protein RecX [Pseudomonadota bacterium]|tara:strand:+ start:103 stop:543 length:441 start_codon:yes stop_codon:yes gene_type:complete